MKVLLMYGMRKGQLLLLPHDPAWTDDFCAEKGRMAGALADPCVRIEHVGSTSIPAVHAKPILDIAILYGENGLGRVIQSLLGLGYEYRGQFDDEVGQRSALLTPESWPRLKSWKSPST
jgi:GrpB-like predicted nucleotidyltransferase (UPF0157 family)